MKIQRIPVPGLTRDLYLQISPPRVGGGPGSGPGRGSPLVNRSGSVCMYGALRLHHGFQTVRSNLCRPNRQPFRARRSASRRGIRAYREIQDPHFGLVRSARQLCNQPSTRTGHQTLASGLEEYADRRAQSELAGRYFAYSVLNHLDPGLEPGPHLTSSAWINQRSRVRPGTGSPYSIRKRT